LLLAAGCGADFTPASVLFDLRVLAVRATPLEVGLAESVTLDAVRVPPPGATIAEERWTFCPFSVGSTAGYSCAAPACEVELAPSGAPSAHVSAPVTASPGALALDCVALLSGSGTLPSEVPERVDTVFRYVVRASDGSSRETVQRFGEVRPSTLGQASRIPGVTAAAVAVVGAYLERFSHDATGVQREAGKTGPQSEHLP
jgi:hypothetical protein